MEDLYFNIYPDEIHIPGKIKPQFTDYKYSGKSLILFLSCFQTPKAEFFFERTTNYIYELNEDTSEFAVGVNIDIRETYRLEEAAENKNHGMKKKPEHDLIIKLEKSKI